MKINEVTQLNEGPLDFVKKVGAGAKGLAQGGFAGAKAGYQTKGAQLQQKDLTKRVASNVIQQWGAQAQNIQTSTGQPPTPEDVVQWFSQLMGGSQPASSPASVNPAAVNQWLNKEIAGYMAKKALGQQQPVQQEPAQQQQPVQQTPPAQGVSLVSKEPVIIKYQGKDYGLNDQGQWVSQKTGKMPPEAVSSFLDQQAEALTGASFAKSAPTATATIQTAQPSQQVAEVPDISKMSREDLLQLQQVLKGSAQ